MITWWKRKSPRFLVHVLHQDRADKREPLCPWPRCARPPTHTRDILSRYGSYHSSCRIQYFSALARSVPSSSIFPLIFHLSLSLTIIKLHYIRDFIRDFKKERRKRIITRILDFLFFRKICNDLITDKRNTHRGEFWLKGRLKLREIIWQILIRDLGVDIETVASMVCTVLFAGIGGQITQNNIPCFRNTCTRRRNYYARIGKSKLFYTLTTSWKYFMSGI